MLIHIIYVPQTTERHSVRIWQHFLKQDGRYSHHDVYDLKETIEIPSMDLWKKEVETHPVRITNFSQSLLFL